MLPAPPLPAISVCASAGLNPAALVAPHSSMLMGSRLPTMTGPVPASVAVGVLVGLVVPLLLPKAPLPPVPAPGLIEEAPPVAEPGVSRDRVSSAEEQAESATHAETATAARKRPLFIHVIVNLRSIATAPTTRTHSTDRTPRYAIA